MPKDYELQDYIRDYVEYCNKYRDSDRHYPKGRKPKVESYFRSLDEFHPEERAHHRIERDYWKYDFRLGTVISVGSIVTICLSAYAVIISKQSAKDAHDAMIASQTQATYAKISYEASARAAIVTYGIEWSEPPQKDKEGYLQISFGNTGKDFTVVKVRPQYDYGNAVSKFGYGTVKGGETQECGNTDIAVIQGISVSPISNSTYRIPFAVPKEAVNTMLSNQYSLIVKGCFVYHDFERTFFTPFCYVAGQGSSTATLTLSPLCDEGEQPN